MTGRMCGVKTDDKSIYLSVLLLITIYKFELGPSFVNTYIWSSLAGYQSRTPWFPIKDTPTPGRG